MPALDDFARQVPGSKASPLRLNRLLGSRDVCPMALLQVPLGETKLQKPLTVNRLCLSLLQLF